MSEENEEKKDFSETGGQILSFLSDGRFFAFEITAVTDIIEIPEITRIPRVPDFIRGVINLRGKVVPVIDFRKKLGFPDGIYDDRSCIIVLEIGSYQAGIICDRVSDVENILPEQVAQSPVSGGTVKFFVTTAKKRISLLDPAVLVKGRT